MKIKKYEYQIGSIKRAYDSQKNIVLSVTRIVSSASDKVPISNKDLNARLAIKPSSGRTVKIKSLKSGTGLDSGSWTVVPFKSSLVFPIVASPQQDVSLLTGSINPRPTEPIYRFLSTSFQMQPTSTRMVVS